MAHLPKSLPFHQDLPKDKGERPHFLKNFKNHLINLVVYFLIMFNAFNIHSPQQQQAIWVSSHIIIAGFIFKYKFLLHRRRCGMGPGPRLSCLLYEHLLSIPSVYLCDGVPAHLGKHQESKCELLSNRVALLVPTLTSSTATSFIDPPNIYSASAMC